MFFENENCIFRIASHQNYGYNAHFQPAYEMYYIRSGCMSARINGETLEVFPGDMFVVNPMEVHVYYPSSVKTEVWSFIVSDPFLSDVKQERGNVRLPNFLPDRTYNLKIANIFETYYNQYGETTPSFLVKKAYTNLIFDALTARYEYKSHKMLNENITRILDYINSNYKQDLSLEILANHFGYTETSFSRLFSKYVNMDIRQYINRIRIAAADKMLSNPAYADTSVLEICMRCGFNSQTTFYRAYKQYHNTLPRSNSPKH